MLLSLALSNFFIFTYTSILCWIIKGQSLQILDSLWSFLLSSILSYKFWPRWSMRTLISISSTQGVSWAPPWLLSLVPGPVNFSSPEAGTFLGLTSFVSYLLLSFVAQCPVSWKPLSYIFVLFLFVSGVCLKFFPPQ